MKKKISKNKRFLSLALIFLFSINTFGTSVNNNDGSAFITKAEFDALKSSFQTQVNTYNQGIDSKIDEAISAYLSNIDLSGDVIDYVEKINEQTGNKFRCVNQIPGIGQATVTTDCNFTINFDIYKKTPVVYARVRARNNNSAPGIYYDVCSTNANMNKSNVDNDLFTSHCDGKQLSLPTSFNTSNWYGINDLEHGFVNIPSSKVFAVSTGQGSLWEYYEKPDGKIKLSCFNYDYFPIQTITVNNHQYKEYWTKHAGATLDEKTALQKYLTTSTGADLGITETIEVTQYINWGTISGGDPKTSSDTTSGSWWSMELSKMQAKDTDDWEVLQIGSDLSKTKIYCINQNKKLSAGTIDSKNLAITYTETYYPATGTSARDVNVGTIIGKYYPVSYSPEQKELNKFINDIITNLAGEDVFLGGGAPMCKVPKPAKVKFDLEFALEDASGTIKGGSIKIKISDRQFKDGDFATGAEKHKDITESITTTADGGKKSYTFECKEGETVWFNLEPLTVGDRAWIKSATYAYVY